MKTTFNLFLNLICISQNLLIDGALGTYVLHLVVYLVNETAIVTFASSYAIMMTTCRIVNRPQ